VSGGPARGGAPDAAGPADAPIRLRAYHFLAAIPALGMLIGVPFANHVHTSVLGLPFMLFWILCWVVATSGCMFIVYRLDRDRQPEAHMPPEEGGP
jgi:hypothetical protein